MAGVQRRRSRQSPVLRQKHVRLLSSKFLAHVTPGRDPKQVIYDVEGSFSRRCCKVYDDKRCPVAEIKCKEAAVGGVTFGADVFRLVVEPQLDTTVAMSLVIMLDQMFGPR
ncbi:protein LURP-one-related 8-like protein [Cinnamomum micranthum f. kanehirae]|uniref:Protein LURP-one-related 8-like protein n=1 Tax=Cinnamomum micranthum f. kanehirae TaxID=337451 RepID=A0A443NKP8_9MAGN|nr:protein LURP-one-related 8-like protein [Cinnamomum micranthum f. kanehirae]